MKFKILYIAIIALILFSLVFPRPVLAILGTGLFDYFESALGGIEELAGPFTGKIIKFFFYYVIGLVLLHTSAAFLEMAMDPSWLQIQGNPVVEYGWRFTANIASMFLILFLIFIAFTIILKINTPQAKKSLVRLVLVAVLMNFSLLFVGIMVDISNIFYNTLFIGNSDLPSRVIESLGASGWDILTSMIGWIGALAISFLIPFVGPFVQYALAIGMIGIYLPNLIVWMFQVVCFFMVAGIFFFYTILFAARVFIIQLLAMVSPLALLAYIFPKTEKYFKMWFKYLLEWLFLGVILFFFLALGLAATNALMPRSGPVPLPMVGWGEIGGYLIYYFFLVTYLGIAAMVAKKSAPTLANQFIAMAKGGAEMAITRGLKPIGKDVRRKLSGWSAKQEKAKKEGKHVAFGKLGGAVSTTVKWGHKAAGTTPEISAERDAMEQSANLERRFGSNVDAARDYYGAWYGRLRKHEKAGYALYATKMKGDKGLSTLSDEEVKEAAEIIADTTPEKLKDVVKYRQDLIEESPTIQKAMVSKAFKKDPKTGEFKIKKDEEGDYEDRDIQILSELGYSEADAIRLAAFKKATDALKNEDVEKLGAKTLENQHFQENVARFKGWGFVRKLGEEKGLDYASKIQDKAESIGLEEIARTNASFLRAAYSPGGVFLREWKDDKGKEYKGKKGKEEINELIKKSRKVVSWQKGVDTLRTRKAAEEWTDEEPKPAKPPPPPPPGGPKKPPSTLQGVLDAAKEERERKEKEDWGGGRTTIKPKGPEDWREEERKPTPKEAKAEDKRFFKRKTTAQKKEGWGREAEDKPLTKEERKKLDQILKEKEEGEEKKG